MIPTAMHSLSSVSAQSAGHTMTMTSTNTNTNGHTSDPATSHSHHAMKVPTIQSITKLADAVDDLFNGCKEIVLHFNMGIYNGLDQLTHTGPETYTNRVVERMHAIDMLCDEMLVDLGPGAELEAIFAPSAAETSSGVAVPSFAPTRHTRQPPSQLQMATNEQDAMQVDPDPSSSNDAAHREQIDPQKWATDFLLSVFEADALAVMGQGKQGVLTAPPSPTVGAAGQLGQGEAAGADKAGVEERVEDELMAMLVD